MDMNFKKYKTVSFDIFDTLVSRRIYRPRDLFSLMQSTLATEKFFISAYEIGIIDNFPEIRVQAEVSAKRIGAGVLAASRKYLYLKYTMKF